MARAAKKTKQPETAPDNAAQITHFIEPRGPDVPGEVVALPEQPVAVAKPKQHVEHFEKADAPFEIAQKNADLAFARFEAENKVKLAPPSNRRCEIEGKAFWHFYTETL